MARQHTFQHSARTKSKRIISRTRRLTSPHRLRRRTSFYFHPALTPSTPSREADEALVESLHEALRVLRVQRFMQGFFFTLWRYN
jgi:hypothetical protein